MRPAAEKGRGNRLMIVKILGGFARAAPLGRKMVALPGGGGSGKEKLYPKFIS